MKKKLQLKEKFKTRMKTLLEEEYESYIESLSKSPQRSIRCNTLKISPKKLRKRLEKYNWQIKQPWKNYPEVMIIESDLEPGELGRSLEHLLGYYYIQELSSMLPTIALNPEPDESVLDLCASPGSKTTQIAAKMKNTGSLMANEISLGRIKILASNLEKNGVANVIITKKEGAALCRQLNKRDLTFDKILIDAPCSGEGTLRSAPKTSLMWNPNTITSLSKVQKDLLKESIKILNPGGTIVYSTCTHAPEENEEVLDYILRNFPEIKIEKINLPINTTKGILKWQEKEYIEEVQLACRVYPHQTNTEGFFIAKLRRTK